LFINGAEADVKPVEGGFDGAEAVGEGLGAAVESVWQATETNASATLEIQTAQVQDRLFRYGSRAPESRDVPR
jgi:hypothetical protein